MPRNFQSQPSTDGAHQMIVWNAGEGISNVVLVDLARVLYGECVNDHESISSPT